ncbi:MAG: hypothetical protein DWC09_07265 [Candidatus Poseidoniales archaeon]|nr:MAG: hypothetical protein DWC09_07265 [Candidatus Poseidoniales archaeon]
MVDLLGYGEKDSTPQSLITLALITGLTLFFFFQWDMNSLLIESFPTFHSSTFPLVLVFIWRLFCLAVGASALVFMYRMETGTMIVIDHETRKERLTHPVKSEKFVTFSSWTLLSNFAYFLIASIATYMVLVERSAPQWIEAFQVALFSTAIGAAFLTSTVVRLVILPGEVQQRRNHDHQFLFHNQIMHNFAAIFLAIEILLAQPQIQPEFALFGLLLGVVYAVFAYPFAAFWKGYYVYGFIDPRLKYAPLLQSGLAGAISVFYLGLWLGSELVSYNFLLGFLLLVLWVSQIVQFKSALPKESEL